MYQLESGKYFWYVNFKCQKGITMRTVSTFFLICLAIGVNAQSKLTVNSNSTLIVSGTSTLHDWEIEADQVSGYATFDIQEGILSKVSDLNIKVKSTDLKSGKSGMDNNTYKALKAEEFEYIIFKLSESTLIKEGSNYLVKGTGNLTVAGFTRQIDISSTCEITSGTVKCKGSYTMKMTDWKIEPPTAMFGTIKTGDEITIDFETTFNNSNLSKL